MTQEQSSSQNKTEKPTSKKLRDLRKKGEVPISRDLTATVSMLVATIGSVLMFQAICSDFMEMIKGLLSLNQNDLDTPQAFIKIAQSVFLHGALIAVPFVLMTAAASLVTAFLQVGGLIAFDHVTPKLSRINPIEGIKRMFALRNFIELIKLLIKGLLLFSIVFFLVRQMLPVLFNARFLPTQSILVLSGKILSRLMWVALIGFIFLAVFDVWFQRWNYTRKNRMTKDEIKREYKESEGDPYVRSKRRQLQRELSMERMLDNVRKANVVIVNPTHIAIALYYDPDETDLPVVIAKGEGFVAQAIREVAEQERIPILHNIQLARQLQSMAPLDQYIPDELVEPVAAVMRWVRDLRYT